LLTFDAELRKELTFRLSRAEGQVRTVQSMIDDGIECKKLICQLAAARKAPDGVALIMITEGMREYLKAEIGCGSEESESVEEVNNRSRRAAR